MKIIGVLLVIVGIFGLVYGGIGYNRNKSVVDAGPLHVTTTEHKNIPVSPVVGVLALVGGIALIVADKRRIA